jgi:hypothetical protein
LIDSPTRPRSPPGCEAIGAGDASIGAGKCIIAAGAGVGWGTTATLLVWSTADAISSKVGGDAATDDDVVAVVSITGTATDATGAGSG